MGKVLCGFYLLVGIFSTISIFTAFIGGNPVLSTWLVFAAIINFFLFYLVWQTLGPKANSRKYKHIKVVK